MKYIRYKQRITAVFLSAMMAFQNASLITFAENNDSYTDSPGISEDYDNMADIAENQEEVNELTDGIDFSNKRLLVITDDSSVFADDTDIVFSPIAVRV